MAPATTTKSAPPSSSAGSSERISVGLPLKADDAECSDSAASSLDHLAPVCSSSPGASYNGAVALAWHDDGDTTDDQDDVGWQLVPTKNSHKAASSSTGGHSKAAVCGRCGMKGHLSSRCRQPHCTRCNKWWHTEEECSRACHACGSLEHKISATTPMCKSYKCRECGLYGHVYAECPNIICNLCKQVGHKALDCPSIICNLCKQQGHKAVNCPNPRALHNTSAAGGSKGASKQAALDEQQAMRLRSAVPSQLRQSGSSCGSNCSPTSFAAAAAAAASAADGHSAAVPQQVLLQEDVPLLSNLHQPATAAELQARQQQQSQLLSQLYKAAPDAAVAFLDSSSKLEALFCIEPRYLMKLIQSLPQHRPSAQQSLLDSAVESVSKQQQQRQEQPPQQQQQPAPQQPQAWQQPPEAAAGAAGGQHEHPVLRSAISSSSGSTPASPATPKPASVGDVGDATQGIKPGDLAPQLAKQLVAEFGDMLPNRWQQLPSWRQLEARLSFPDGNYVQRRLQFREKRRQLQLLTLQMRAAAAAARQQQAAGRAAAGSSARPGPKAVRVVAQVPAAGSPAAAAAPMPAVRPGACAPSSYAAALAGHRAASGAGSDAGTFCASSTAEPASASTCGGAEDGAASPDAVPNCADSSSSALTQVHTQQPEQSSIPSIAVCRRCGMMGHAAQQCAQPKCSRCHLWWHSEAQCASACQFCGALDHQGDAEQPSSCLSFKCKACKMFGHTASTCPHVQLHQHQEKARQLQQQQQQQQLGLQQDQQHQQQQQPPGISPVATPTSVAAVPSSLSSSSNSSSFQQLALQAPASPLGKFGAGSNSSSTWDSPLRPPDSPGLGQHGVKPKDLLPEHAKALQEEFPNALPPGWQQMASWRMVEERLRVVAVEGAVFSKRRQMWRDRRKHYQVLTAQALAAAARSAANDAAAADAAAVGEAASAAVAAAGEGGASGPCAAAASDSAASTDTALGAGGLSVHGEVSSKEVAPQEQQEASACAAHMSDGMAPQQSVYQPLPVEQQVAATGTTGVSQDPQPQPPQPQQQQQQQAAPHQLALLQRQEHEDLVPEWQQQRGSLFGLSALPASSGVLDGQAGSTFSCDTASFCCSPIPAVTPSVLLSPLGPDALGTSAGTTPGTAPCGSSSLSTPLIFAGTAGPAVSRHPSGPLHQVPSSQSLAGMSPRATPQSTPMPTPRGAAAAAAAMAAAAASSGAPVSAAMGPYGVLMGPLPADAAGGYSPVHYPGGPGVPPRVPVGYGMPQQSSPLPHMAGSSMGAAGRGMPSGMMNMAGSPALYQQMLVAQRQSQLQQQLMLQSPYAPRAPPPPSTEGAAAGNPQMMLNMQMQQHQARMQRQRRLEQAFMVQQASTRQQQTPAQPEDVGETGELDDKLGVLGVLGLQ